MVFHMEASAVPEQVRAGKIEIVVIGLGYAGLPLALYFAKEGSSVVGVDTDSSKIALLREGICPVTEMFLEPSQLKKVRFTPDINEASRSGNVYIISVPTLLNEENLPDLSAVIAASTGIAQGLKKGDMVVLGSSVYPGVTTKIVKPILERGSALQAGRDFGLAHCFERIDLGNIEHRIDNTPVVVGGIDDNSTAIAAALYSVIIKTEIVKVKNPDTAEMVKMAENVYRDINIAFSNELSLLCERLDIDILEVLNAASTKWSFTPHLPGAGVGGSCIPVNPYYLLKCATEAGLDLKLVRCARERNENMPHHMVALVDETLNSIGKSIRGSKIAILGLAYKADVDDCRGSPAKQIGNELKKLGARVAFYDPVATTTDSEVDLQESLEGVITGADCVVIATDHSCFKSLPWSDIARLATKPLVVIDGKHILTPREVEAMGIVYRGLGRDARSDLNIWNVRFKAGKQSDREE